MLGRRVSVLWAGVAPFAFASVDGRHISALPEAPGLRGERTAEQAAIEQQPVCIGSSVASAGALSDILYYRAVALDEGGANETAEVKVEVGYFAFFSEERPWGNNWLTWSVVPALAVDLFYSRALLVAPGLQRALYGAGDVEGVGIVYDRSPNGSLRFDHAIADDGTHDPVALSRQEAFALDRERPTFYSQVWSHQLGGHGAISFADLAYVRCYDAGSIRPLPESVAQAFKVDGDFRAPPAHVERAGGRRIDVASDTALGRASERLPSRGADRPGAAPPPSIAPPSVRALPRGSRCAG